MLKWIKFLVGIMCLPLLLASCDAAEEGTAASSIVGAWQNSHEAEIEAMTPEDKSFYESLSDDKKDEIRETRRVVYNFLEGGRFEKKHGEKVDKGNWKLSADKKKLTITYDDGQVDELIVKKLLSNEVRVGKQFGLHKDDIILEPY
ncbi:hypothetical protein BKI52_09335 [marine bacterium AO1-C]|nr:hypothetical protein BKI52_09335 [marine bacterium AO1-C]